MAGPAYLATSLAATWASQQTVSSGFPIANLSDGRQNKVCKTNGAETTWRLTADLASAKPVSVVALCNHDLPAGTTVEIRKSSDNFAANDVQVMAATAGVSLVSSAFTFASATERYWRVIVTQPSSRVATIGEIFIGARTDLARNFTWDYSDTTRVKTARHESASRAQWIYGLGDPARVLEFPWEDLTDSQKAELVTMLTDCAGRLFLFVLLAGNSTPTAIADQDCILGVLGSDEYGMRRQFTDLNVGGRLVLLEDSRGLG